MASINLQGDTSGSISISAPSVAGSNTLTLPATTQTLATQNALGVRNLIINGDMRIDQRNAGASVTPANGNYTLDRWINIAYQASKFSVQQNAGSVTPPVGFSNYMGVTSLSSYTVGASEYFAVIQRIEQYNVSNLSFGNANAKTITLSFQVYSSLTGTFGGTIQNNATNRSYPFSYEIAVANTWTPISITINGDTTGTWSVSGNATGMQVAFNLGAGSTFSSTANTWASGQYQAPTGATSIVGTSGATWYITAVQLEVGDTATPFEHRPYDMELQRCQRYYQKHDGMIASNGNESTRLYPSISFKTEMRATPSLSQSGVLSFVRPSAAVYSQSSTTVTLNSGSSTGARLDLQNFSGLATNQIYIQNTNGAYVLLNAEL
jgi:hypothetical protein